MSDGITVQPSCAECINEDGACGQQRLAGVEVVDGAGKEAQHVMTRGRLASEELTAGNSQYRRETLFDAFEDEAERRELAERKASRTLVDSQLTRELSDVERRVLCLSHTGRL